MATLYPAQEQDSFDAAAWLAALTQIGGGYALMSGRRLAFMVEDCDPEDLAVVMSHLIGRADRQEAIKAAIERRQCGETA
ncbi:hypothetical protein [Sphingomonas aracearum]|uniref:Uncharacterized protein n=1 Tax=Sphingomonas aracearum TaxID=2283317 RepID=A0A369VT42_9SPHN|nr:hypothetical protein [Sphingomonas aracearum]RDE05574.1 hypothetical protein DVW87_10095 [Sphingomonas aracearum]